MSLLGGVTSPSSTSTGTSGGFTSPFGTSLTSALNDVYNHLGQALSLKSFSQGQVLSPTGLAALHNSAKYEAQFEKATQLLKWGDTVGARTVGEQLKQANPRDPVALQIIGRSYMLEGDYRLAERTFQKAYFLSGQDPRIQTDINKAKLMQKEDDEILQAAVARFQDPSQKLSALTDLVALTERSPHNAEAFLALGDALESVESGKAAIGAYASALEAAGDDKVILTRIEASLKTFTEAHPTAGIGFDLLGVAQQRLGKFENAQRSIERALEISPENATYQSDLADVYDAIGLDNLNKGRLREAKHYFLKAHDLDRSDKGYEDHLADVHLEQGKKFLAAGALDQAYTELDTARRKHQSNDAFERDLAIQFNAVGDRYAALEENGSAMLAYQKAHAISPDNYTFRSNLARIHMTMGQEFEDDGDLAEAVSRYQQAYDLDQTNAIYKDKLRTTLIAVGDEESTEEDYSEAADYYQRAYDLDNTDITLRTKLIDTYTSLADKQASEDRLDQAYESRKKAFYLDATNDANRIALASSADAYGLSQQFIGKIEEAIDLFRFAIYLDPAVQEYQDHLDTALGLL